MPVLLSVSFTIYYCTVLIILCIYLYGFVMWDIYMPLLVLKYCQSSILIEE